MTLARDNLKALNAVTAAAVANPQPYINNLTNLNLLCKFSKKGESKFIPIFRQTNCFSTGCPSWHSTRLGEPKANPIQQQSKPHYFIGFIPLATISAVEQCFFTTIKSRISTFGQLAVEHNWHRNLTFTSTSPTSQQLWFGSFEQSKWNFSSTTSRTFATTTRSQNPKLVFRRLWIDSTTISWLGSSSSRESISKQLVKLWQFVGIDPIIGSATATTRRFLGRAINPPICPTSTASQ